MLYIVIFNVIYVLLGQKPNKTKKRSFLKGNQDRLIFLRKWKDKR